MAKAESAPLRVSGSGVSGSGATQRLSQNATINGIRISLPWVEWKTAQGSQIGISDLGLRQLGGIDLLNSDRPDRQPIQWRSAPLQENGQFLELAAQRLGPHRYLSVQPLIDEAGWQMTVVGDQLQIQTRSILQISNLLLGRTLGNVFGPHDIIWAEGIRWKQDYVREGGAEFPVTQLNLDLKQPNLVLEPVWPVGESLVGIARFGETLAARQAIAGINGGFFNRNNQTPLGALRVNGEWLSGPILNRAVLGWNQAGQIVMDRLTLEETLVTAAGEFQNIALNSGYLKAGFARYTPAWGTTYVPLTDNEVLIYVRDGVVVQQRETGKAGVGSFPVSLPEPSPRDDLKTYLLVARSNRTGAGRLPVGTAIELRQRWSAPGLERSPQIVGAGPLLIQNSRIVLDAKAEGFSDAFIREQAPRSVVALFEDGTLSLMTVHERIGGRGPSLNELARLLRSLGATQAINLDGGSSTQLFLGESLINRSPRSAARVHTGIGLFLPPQTP